MSIGARDAPELPIGTPREAACHASVVDEWGASKPWYYESVVVVILLWLCFPIGLFLMWRGATWRQAVKVVITAAFVVLLTAGITAGLLSPR